MCFQYKCRVFLCRKGPTEEPVVVILSEVTINVEMENRLFCTFTFSCRCKYANKLKTDAQWQIRVIVFQWISCSALIIAANHHCIEGRMNWMTALLWLCVITTVQNISFQLVMAQKTFLCVWLMRLLTKASWCFQQYVQVVLWVKIVGCLRERDKYKNKMLYFLYL